MQKILKNSQGVHYLYVIRVERNNLVYLFDMDTGKEQGYTAGAVKPIDESFSPYLDQLVKGEDVGTVIGKEGSEMVLTAFAPIKTQRIKQWHMPVQIYILGICRNLLKNFWLSHC